MAHFLEQRDVVALLRQVVDQAGGQQAWSDEAGLDRTNVNHVLHGRMPPTKAIVAALGLRVVYAATPPAAQARRPSPKRRRQQRSTQRGT